MIYCIKTATETYTSPSEVSRPISSAQAILAPDAAWWKPANSEWAVPQMWLKCGVVGGGGLNAQIIGNLICHSKRRAGSGWGGVLCVCVWRGLRWGGGFPLIIHWQYLMWGVFLIGFTSDKTWKENSAYKNCLSTRVCHVWAASPFRLWFLQQT